MNPHRVVTLALPTVNLLDVAAPSQIFGELAGDRYEFELAALTEGPVETSPSPLVTVVARRGLEALKDADTIIVPGFSAWDSGSFPEAASALGLAHRRGARVMSICTGAFVLAEAGLLDGRRATTHWVASETLATRFPKVKVDPGVLYIDEGSILTSAGVAAGLDLCLHVVRRDHGAAVAADLARWIVIAPHREGGQAQFIPLPSRATSSPLGATIEPARTWALAHLDEPVSVMDLAEHAFMSRRTFTRRFRSETGVTPAQWLLEQRLRAAQSLLETTDEPIEQIARKTGFANAAALRAHFGRRLQTTPTAYRRLFTTVTRSAIPVNLVNFARQVTNRSSRAVGLTAEGSHLFQMAPSEELPSSPFQEPSKAGWTSNSFPSGSTIVTQCPVSSVTSQRKAAPSAGDAQLRR